MASEGQRLEVVYADAEAFGSDYHANLANAGVFVETDAALELRETVIVSLRLAWCDRQIDFPGEIVHRVPAEMVEVGGRPGVAVQFHEAPASVREKLESLCPGPPPPAPPNPEEDRREARKAVRIEARLDTEGGPVWGRTRNLSRGGVLIGIQEGLVLVGERVRVALKHPSTGEELEIDGVVVREVEKAGTVTAVAVNFDPGDRAREGVERFIEEVQGVEHTRRLGSISGPIAELGPQSIVQMFATTAPQGTIILRRGEEEGVICFEGGVMRLARTGATRGMKALVRMLSWREGTFEFHTGLEEGAASEAPFPLEAAVFDAVRQIDEVARVDSSSFPLLARLVVAQGSDPAATGSLSKVEAALLDLARVGFSVQRALEVIPEPDPEIFRALGDLIDAGQLELR